MSSSAERELRDIAQGDTENVASLAYDAPADPWLPIRAAGSLGAIDLVLCRGSRVLLIEVKATSTVREAGATVQLTDNNGRGLEQRDLLANALDKHHLWGEAFLVGFAVRRKGPRPEGVPRWTWHEIEDVGDETVLRADDGEPFLPLLHA